MVLPNFLLRGITPPKETKAKKSSAPRIAGGTGTVQLKQRMLEADLVTMTPDDLVGYRRTEGADMKVGIAFEARARSSTGQATEVGARVENQLPHDRYRARGELDPTNSWRNGLLWESAGRLRTDFHVAGISSRMCSSFQPRVTGGNRQSKADKQVDALQRYKKAMNAVGRALRPALFYVCIAGQPSNEWATKNAMPAQAGLSILRLALAELAHHYGYMKLPVEEAHGTR